MKRCVLLSGGMDSIAIAYWQRPEIAITVDYGQAPAEAEIAASHEVCDTLNIEHIIIECDCSAVGLGSMLKAPTREASSLTVSSSPSPEWWPFRNQLIVTLAASKSVQLGIDSLLIGTVTTDALHKDGTAEFVRQLHQLIAIQEGGISLEAPALDLTSTELIRVSKVPRSIWMWAHSCHTSNVPCAQCRGCLKYREVAREVSAFDPLC